MSFFSKVKSGQNMLATRSGSSGISGHGTMGFLADKAERYGAAYAFGFAKGYYRERAMWKGYGADLWIGGAATLASAALNIASGGRAALAPHLERIGDAGVTSYFNSMGASAGATKAGRSVLVMNQGQQLPGKKSILGMIPPAMGGAYLSADEIARFASRR